MARLANRIVTFAWSSPSYQASTRSIIADTDRASPISQNSRSMRCEPFSFSEPPPAVSSLVRQPVRASVSASSRGGRNSPCATRLADVSVPSRPDLTTSASFSTTG